MLQRLQKATVCETPFPHVILEEALDPALADELVRQMPPLSVLSGGAPLGSNQRFTLNSADALNSEAVSSLWKSVLTEALSQAFLDQILCLFSPYLERDLPDFSARFGPLGRLQAVPRQRPDRLRNGVGLDAQPSVNTPALTAGTSVRGPHLDRPDKLFVGLLYLRLDADDSTGADLELYEPLEPNPVYLPKRLLPRERVRLVKTVPYRRNTLVLFLNSPRALHGVSPRGVTSHPRYFLNLVGEMCEPLFTVPIEAPDAAPQPLPSQPGLMRRFWNRLLGRAA